MGRPVPRRIDRVDRTRNRRGQNGLFFALVGLIMLFALVGIFSAGSFVYGQMTPSSSSTSKPPAASSTSLALSEITRARAQATAIISAAQSASQRIVKGATASSHRQAAAIIASARKRAAALVKQAGASTTPVTTSPSSPSTAYSQPAYTAPTYTTPGYTPSSTGAAQGLTGQPYPTSPSTPNLGALPATWKVVGYNATFGTGPGGVGGITVLNRSSKTFSGVAVVRFAHGGSASAPFSGLAPGQSLTLPLNGHAYTGGGYSIVLQGLH